MAKEIVIKKRSEDVYVLARLPSKLHRAVKSEAALMNKKINDVVVEALNQWTERRK